MPVILPIPGNDLPGVHHLPRHRRYRGDDRRGEALSARRRHRRRPARARGGERARAARHGRDRRAPDAVADGAPARPHRRRTCCRRSLEAKGLAFRLEAKTERARRRRIAAASPRCGSPTARRSPADLVVMAVGIRPNVELAQAAGLHCDRGIVVNDTMQTFDPRIYAVGECVSHRGTTLRPRRAAVRDGEGLRQPPGAASASAATAAR